MAFTNINEYNHYLVEDCKFSIGEFYDKNSWENYPSPYCVFADYDDPEETYRLSFPSADLNKDRALEFYMLSRALNVLRISRVGIVAYMEIPIPARSEIDERFWDRNCRVALIGSVARGAYTEENIPYAQHVILFDQFDGRVEFCDVSNQSIWADFIDKASIFRDFLFISSYSSLINSLRWREAVHMLREYGFTFDFNSEKQSRKLAMSQLPVYNI